MLGVGRMDGGGDMAFFSHLDFAGEITNSLSSSRLSVAVREHENTFPDGWHIL